MFGAGMGVAASGGVKLTDRAETANDFWCEGAMSKRALIGVLKSRITEQERRIGDKYATIRKLIQDEDHQKVPYVRASLFQLEKVLVHLQSELSDLEKQVAAADIPPSTRFRVRGRQDCK